MSFLRYVVMMSVRLDGWPRLLEMAQQAHYLSVAFIERRRGLRGREVEQCG